MGELEGIYDNAGNAIQAAANISGVVISSDQAYIWESGNRDLSYSIDVEPFRTQSGETSLQACESYMEHYNAHQVDLTGCALDQVLYVINKGCPDDRHDRFQPCNPADRIYQNGYHLYRSGYRRGRDGERERDGRYGKRKRKYVYRVYTVRK